MGSVQLARVGGVAKAAMILVAATGLTGILSWVAGRVVLDDAEAFLDGTLSSDDFTSSIAVYGLLTVVQGAVSLASAVLVIVWMYRIAANHKALHRTGTWGPGWAIG